MDVRLSPDDFDARLRGQLHVLSRNLTIASLACTGVRAIDFSHLGPRLVLGENVVLTFERVRLVRAR